jgi:hypothetical protein
MGPNANTDVCPENTRVGAFSGNHAHSNGRYGLRIFHNMIPREFPCKPIVYDATNIADPWHSNPLFTQKFTDFTGWKNKRNGAIAGTVGDVRFENFKVADNILAGMEMEKTNDVGDLRTGVYGGLVVG